MGEKLISVSHTRVNYESLFVYNIAFCQRKCFVDYELHWVRIYRKSKALENALLRNTLYIHSEGGPSRSSLRDAKEHVARKCDERVGKLYENFCTIGTK